jgi:conjugal transfer pilin signal peptidase TrbI
MFIAIAVFCYNNYGYARNITSSLPHKNFFIVRNKNIKVGDYILFKAPKNSAYDGMFLIKQIIGGDGDKVLVNERDVFINDKLIATAKTHTKAGQVLTVAASAQITKGSYFVANLHQDSYDSRYLDFGLIHEKDISGVAYALW